MNGKYKDVLVRVLLKKAKGYLSREQTDEYSVNENETKLIKSKVVTKRVPPDVAACKVLLEMDLNDINLDDMTDEQLQAEKERLLSILAQCQTDDSGDV